MAGRLEDVILRGVRADQPSASDVSPGTLYFVTDEHVTERSNGIAWQSYSGSGSGTGGSFINGSPFPVPIDGVDGEDSIPIPGPTGPAGGNGINQLTGDVTAGPGNGSQAATIANDAVTTAKIIDDAVTYAKLQNVSTASKLLGRGSASGAGNPEEITLGTNLSMVGTTINASAGTPGNGDWNFIGTNAPTVVTEVDFTGLSAYNELLVVIRALTSSASGTRQVLVSIDNGISFLTSTADYKTINSSGVESNATGIPFHGSPSGAAKTGWIIIRNFNIVTQPKIAECPIIPAVRIMPSTSAFDAIRINDDAGGTLNGGNIYLYGR